MKIKVLTLALLIACYSGITAQNQADDKWKFLIEPYMMFPSMKGNTGIGNLPEVAVDAGASDILGALKIGGMIYFEASTSSWSICSDIIYMNLEQDVKTGTIVRDGSVQMKQFAWEISGLRNVLPWLDVGIGLRLNSLEAGFDIVTGIGNNQTDHSRGQTKTWIDPILIARSQGIIGSSKWTYMLRADIGGFGIGSDIAWQIQPYIGYRFTKLFQLSAGYRVIAMDYETGTGDDYFKYDVDTSGPVLRLGFNL
jgi:hypothetical protein